jgi:hypothetical protein
MMLSIRFSSQEAPVDMALLQGGVAAFGAGAHANPTHPPPPFNLCLKTYPFCSAGHNMAHPVDNWHLSFFTLQEVPVDMALLQGGVAAFGAGAPAQPPLTSGASTPSTARTPHPTPPKPTPPVTSLPSRLLTLVTPR